MRRHSQLVDLSSPASIGFDELFVVHDAATRGVPVVNTAPDVDDDAPVVEAYAG